MTHVGSYLTAKGIKPIVKFKHNFQNTYLYGSYSPIDGDAFVYELEHTTAKLFEDYLAKLSQHRTEQFKIVVIDNAAFHSTKNIEVPENIFLINIPPYTPELNPCEQVWAYIKQRFKNQCFENLNKLKKWLYQMVNTMDKETVKSIVGNKHYLNSFNATFNI
jgi:transposase